uniref:Uncharacterized protein n=1 Tax=Arundo donax TaxID=35708 RepID=A0A0A9E231_ARUDO
MLCLLIEVSIVKSSLQHCSCSGVVWFLVHAVFQKLLLCP